MNYEHLSTDICLCFFFFSFCGFTESPEAVISLIFCFFSYFLILSRWASPWWRLRQVSSQAIVFFLSPVALLRHNHAPSTCIILLLVRHHSQLPCFLCNTFVGLKQEAAQQELLWMKSTLDISEGEDGESEGEGGRGHGYCILDLK